MCTGDEILQSNRVAEDSALNPSLHEGHLNRMSQHDIDPNQDKPLDGNGSSPDLLTSPEIRESAQFEIFSSEEYLVHLCEHAIPNEEEEIHLQCMTFYFRAETEIRLRDAILAKRKSDPDVPITIYLRVGDDLTKADKLSLEALYNAGVTRVPTQRGLFLNDLTGQNHRKLGWIGKKVYWGGTNFHNEVITDTLDCMIATSYPPFVDIVRNTLLHNTRPARSLKHPFYRFELQKPIPDPYLDATVFDVIIENGGPDRKSEIINEAVRMIEQAKNKVVLVSQFLPDGRVLRALIDAAKKGVEIEVITNNPGEIDGVMYHSSATVNLKKIIWARDIHNFMQRRNGKDVVKFNVRTLPFRVHMKAIFVDDIWCMAGSDNFVRAGEIFQTAESAVKTDHKGINNGLRRLVNRYVREFGGPVFIDIDQ